MLIENIFLNMDNLIGESLLLSTKHSGFLTGYIYPKYNFVDNYHLICSLNLERFEKYKNPIESNKILEIRIHRDALSNSLTADSLKFNITSQLYTVKDVIPIYASTYNHSTSIMQSKLFGIVEVLNSAPNIEQYIMRGYFLILKLSLLEFGVDLLCDYSIFIFLDSRTLELKGVIAR